MLKQIYVPGTRECLFVHGQRMWFTVNDEGAYSILAGSTVVATGDTSDVPSGMSLAHYCAEIATLWGL